MKMKVRSIILLCFTVISTTSSSDITSSVFGNLLDGMPAAFGDFNSDELTDVFVLRKGAKRLDILLASDQEPLLKLDNLTCSFNNNITSVVPGDFDGDAFMDVLVTTLSGGLTFVYILWNANEKLICADESKPVIKMRGQPLTIDYNQDMIIDLFGSDSEYGRSFWIFNHNRSTPLAIPMDTTGLALSSTIRNPHSNAFLDLNYDYYPDIMITTKKYFEIWNGTENGFKYSKKVPWPYEIAESNDEQIGQALYLDVELKGKIDLVVPICFDRKCTNSTIAVYNNEWHNMQINFRDNFGVLWGFVSRDAGRLLYTDTMTLRGGDFDMDGYPDLLATLQSSKTLKIQSFLLLNVASTSGSVKRNFEVQWDALNPFTNQTTMAVFYDFYQDGILDVILVQYDDKKDQYMTGALKNSVDYDASFVKVMVLTGLTNSKYPISPGSLVKKKSTYGTNLPGPSIAYTTTTQDGYPRRAIAAQLPQSAHFSLNLPYTTFGLGRTPNFVDKLIVGVAGKNHEWTQIIPNSQMVVIPNPINDPTRWKAQLFVTPGKLILMSAAALAATCSLIIMIILGLWWKERREDKLERLQEAHRFHFDAM